MTEIAILNLVANRGSIYIRYQAFEIETVVLAMTEPL